MRLILLVLAVVLSTIVTAIELDNRVLSLSLSRSKLTPSSRQKRSSISTSLSNQHDFYVVNATFGSNKQELALNIGSGSGDTWVPSEGSDACEGASAAECTLYGSYDPTTSSPSNLSLPFSTLRGDGSKIAGYYLSDIVSIAGVDINSFQFGIVTQDTSVPVGVLGLGYETSEATTGQGKNNSNTYPNFLSILASEGAINSKTFSLYLNDTNSPTGEIIFGGFDTEKFVSPLSSMPIVPSIQNIYSQPQVALTQVSFTSDGQSFTYTNNNFALTALLDSASKDILLPSDLVKAIMQSWNATFDSGAEAYYLPCSAATDSTAKLTFGFNGNNNATIDVHLSTLLEFGTSEIEIAGQLLCNIPISNGDSTPGGNAVVLGTFFLRSAYVIFDLTNNMISMAQSKLNISDSSVQELQDTTSIPGAMVMTTIVSSLNVSATATSVLQTTSSIPTFMFTQTPTTTTQPGSGSNSTNGSNSSTNNNGNDSHIPIIVGCTVGIGGGGLVAGFLYWMYRRWRDKRYRTEAGRAAQPGDDMELDSTRDATPDK